MIFPSLIQTFNPYRLKYSNIVCGVIYTHPNISKLETFKNCLDPILDKISKEKSIMMVDFNINLLNFETHYLKEAMYRSKVKLLEQGEKATKYFFIWRR